MSKNVVLTLESRFMDEYGEYANLPVFNAHGSIVGYVGGEVPESGNPCEFNRLNDEGFTFCASATEVVRLKADNAKLRELAAGIGHLLFKLDVDYCATCPRDDINHPCPVYTVKGGECLYETDLRDIGVEVDG